MSPPVSGPVEIEIRQLGEARVALLTLADRRRRNVMSKEMAAAMTEAVSYVEKESGAGALVVTGEGTAFCAGGVLEELLAASRAARRGELESARSQLSQIYEGFTCVAHCSLPTVAAINGPAVGAGMNLALACDVRVIGASGYLECRFAELGIQPGGGHLFLLERLVGPETAAAMALFAEVVRGADAVKRGLAWRCVADEELVREALELAARAALAGPSITAPTKRSLTGEATLASHEEALSYELDSQLSSLLEPSVADRLESLRQRLKKT